MIYRCLICGNWCEYYSYGHSGYWLQTDNQSGIRDQTIIDEWNTISIPPAPELQSIAVDPKTSALLVLDMETTICKNHRCIASISKIHNLLAKTREMGMLVVYSVTLTGNPSDIAWQLAPSLGDPIVKSNVDKFYKTNLEKILQEHCVKTVLITGYAANGESFTQPLVLLSEDTMLLFPLTACLLAILMPNSTRRGICLTVLEPETGQL
jgi:hypothetical protein